MLKIASIKRRITALRKLAQSTNTTSTVAAPKTNDKEETGVAATTYPDRKLAPGVTPALATAGVALLPEEEAAIRWAAGRARRSAAPARARAAFDAENVETPIFRTDTTSLRHRPPPTDLTDVTDTPRAPDGTPRTQMVTLGNALEAIETLRSLPTDERALTPADRVRRNHANAVLAYYALYNQEANDLGNSVGGVLGGAPGRRNRIFNNPADYRLLQETVFGDTPRGGVGPANLGLTLDEWRNILSDVAVSASPNMTELMRNQADIENLLARMSLAMDGSAGGPRKVRLSANAGGTWDAARESAAQFAARRAAAAEAETPAPARSRSSLPAGVNVFRQAVGWPALAWGIGGGLYNKFAPARAGGDVGKETPEEAEWAQKAFGVNND